MNDDKGKESEGTPGNWAAPPWPVPPSNDPWGTSPPNNGWISNPTDSQTPPFKLFGILNLYSIIGISIAVAAGGVRFGILVAHQSVWLTIALDMGLVGLYITIFTYAIHKGRARTGTGLNTSSTTTIAVAIAAIIVIQLASSLLGRDLVGVLRSRPPSISGALGYTTVTGPHGKPLAVGSPWGQSCKPIVLSANLDIPDEMYTQIVQTVSEARADGIDVTIEDRKTYWKPSQLYPDNLTNSMVQFIPIYPQFKTPPTLPNGQPERIGFGYNASLDPGGNHEKFSYLQAILFQKVLTGNPTGVRIATRQLIAFSQGVGGSTARNSGIARGTTVDNFSPRDLYAIQLMSGCQLQPLSGSNTPINT